MFTQNAIMTDLYQLTMAQAYFSGGIDNKRASFYVHFRENPFKGGYSIACGLEQITAFISNYSFSAADCDYLATIKDVAGTPMFSADFIAHLRTLKLSVDVDAVPEGTVVFPNEPVLRITGAILECQLIETAVLNMFNYQTLIATKAARVCQVAKGPVAEFGLRRAQGPAGGLLASRAAYIGGCASTSNVEAGKIFGIPVSGTHAHSWVMAHSSELEAFRAFAQVFPNNSVLLVDTYNVIAGIENAVIVAKEMEQRGQRLSGIRIDSGDLVWLSIRAREILDAADLGYVKIVASNDLDEYTIQSLNEQGARIDMWGVGTRLVTAWEQPALSGVYKLSAIQDQHGNWTPQLKISEQTFKTTLPGVLAARRYFNAEGVPVGDMIFDEQLPPQDDLIIDPSDELRQKDLCGFSYQELLVPCVRGGQPIATQPGIDAIRARASASLNSLHPTNKRFLNPHSYPVGLERSLLMQRDTLIKTARALS